MDAVEVADRWSCCEFMEKTQGEFAIDEDEMGSLLAKGSYRIEEEEGWEDDVGFHEFVKSYDLICGMIIVVENRELHADIRVTDRMCKHQISSDGRCKFRILTNSEKSSVAFGSPGSVGTGGREVLSPGEKELGTPAVPVDEEEPIEVPDVPNGGYGWVIVFAAFAANAIIDGIAYCFGIFLPALVLEFHESKAKTSWVGSILSGFYLSVGPVASALTNRFGCRNVCIAGTVVAGTALGLSTMVTSINVLMVTYGILGGLGFGLIYLPCIVAVSNWFDTRRALATGIAVCGSGVGTFALAPLGNVLLEEYGWRGAYLIFVGILLNCLIVGLLMREPPVARLQPVPEQIGPVNFPTSDSAYFTYQRPDGSWEQRPKLLMNLEPGVHSNLHIELVGTCSAPVGSLQKVPTLPNILEGKALVSQPIPEQKQDERNLDEGDSALGTSGSSGSELEAGKEDSKVSSPPPLQNPPSSGINNNNNNVKAETSSIHSSVSGTPKIVVSSASSVKADFPFPKVGGSHKDIHRMQSTPTLPRKRHLRRNVSASLYEIKTALHKRYSAQPPGSYLSVHPKIPSVQSLSHRPSLVSKVSNASCSSRPRRISVTSHGGGSRRASRGSLHMPLVRKDTFLAGSVQRLPDFQMSTSIEDYRASILSLHQEKDMVDTLTLPPEEVPPEKDALCWMLPASFVEIFREMTDFTLLANPVFLLIGLSSIFGMLGFYVPFVYLVDAATGKGIDMDTACFLLSAVGLTNTLGRVFMGWLSDLPRVDCLLLNNLCLLISGITVAFTPFCNTMFGFTIVAVLFGLCIAGFVSVASIMLVELMGIDRLTNAFGLLLLFRGLSSFLGAPIAGAISDATGSYDASFYTAGGFLILASLIGFIIYLPMLASYRAPLVPAEPLDILEDIPEESESKERYSLAFLYLQGKVKCHDLRGKKKDELQKQLEDLKQELMSLRVAKVTGGAASKLSKIRTLRKSIARIYIVMNTMQKENLRKYYAKKKYKPLDLRPKLTRALRRALTRKEMTKRTKKEERKLRNFPPRMYAIKA
ncbi:unnamed protein product [Darwinula stevensoni]|uniref:Large ribosomal subunit protein uL29 n=1 Tax=Darwinula stevensoni TaxID=69355 RepID=A0A7R9A1G6_9CRUS|nr:unnamed protein product [Darwinula stevensoni]CAG0883434.1 unnamed protein product [Darwinula stevensoni]